MLSLSTVSLVALFSALVAASPTNVTLHKRGLKGPVLSQNFADPGLFRHPTNRNWYVFGTSNGDAVIPFATTSDFNAGTWQYLGDAMPNLPGDVNRGAGVWAPEVVRWGTNDYRMYFSILLNGNGARRCIGGATATVARGPYTVFSSTIACNYDGGGLIDPAVFYDPKGAGNYLMWKVDGNSVGKSTPIQMKLLTSDGKGVQGNTITLFTNDKNDGGLVEAPSVSYVAPWYYVTFSSNTYSTPRYDISYARSQNPTYGWEKVQAPDAPLLQSGQYGGPQGPGHAGLWTDGDGVNMVFAALANGKDDKAGRRLYTANNLCVRNGVMKIPSC